MVSRLPCLGMLISTYYHVDVTLSESMFQKPVRSMT